MTNFNITLIKTIYNCIDGEKDENSSSWRWIQSSRLISTKLKKDKYSEVFLMRGPTYTLANQI